MQTRANADSTANVQEWYGGPHRYPDASTEQTSEQTETGRRATNGAEREQVSDSAHGPARASSASTCKMRRCFALPLDVIDRC